MTLGKRIKTARELLGMTQQDVADQMGVSRGAVALWETDKTRPDHSRLVKLATLMKTDATFLLSGASGQEAGSHECAPQEFAELVEAWKLLLPDERDSLFAQITQRATHNKAVIDQHASLAGTPKRRTVVVSERRNQTTPITFQDRRTRENKKP